MGDESSQLVAALGVLYAAHGTETPGWREADAWLQAFQAGPTAWGVCDAALHAAPESGTGLDVLCFCAQTLRAKVARDYYQLPASSVESLRDSLVGLLVKYAQRGAAGRQVVAQLSLAVAALAVHMERWVGCLEWLDATVRRGAGCPGALLGVLEELPFEASSRGVAVRPQRRNEFRKKVLVEGALEVLNLLAGVLGDAGWDQAAAPGAAAVPAPSMVASCLGCFAAWLPLVFEESGIPKGELGARIQGLAGSPLVDAVLRGLRDEDDDVFGKAVEGAVELVRATEYAGVEVGVGRVLAGRLLHEFMDVARARAPGALSEGDTELAKGLCRVLAEAGEGYVDVLVADAGPAALSFVDGLLTFAGHEEPDVAAITHDFWYKLATRLRDGPADQPAEFAEDERRRAAFLPAFSGLVRVVSAKMAYPPDFNASSSGGDWRPDELDDFKQERNALSGTLSSAACVLGAEDTLRQLAAPLIPGPAASAATWQQREAALHGVRSLSRVVDHSHDRGVGSEVLLAVLGALPQLPELGVPPVLYTVCFVISSYSEWLHVVGAAGAAGGALLVPLAQLVCASGLSSRDGDVADAAAYALARLCYWCRGELAAHIEALLPVYERVITNCYALSSGGAGAPVEGPGASLTLSSVLEVVEAFAYLTSALPIAELAAVLNRLCDPLLVKVASATQRAAAAAVASPGDRAVSASVSGELIMLLDTLSELFRYTNPIALPADYVHPTAEVVQRLFPSMQTLLQTCSRNEQLMEHVCRCLKYALRSTQLHFAPLLPALVGQLAQSFGRDPQSCYLYLSSQCVKIFGAEAAYETPLAGCIGELVPRSLALLPRSADIDRQPDVAEDLFGLGVTVLQCAPFLLFSASRSASSDPMGLLAPLLGCALEGATVQHREACRSALEFVQYVLDLATGANVEGVSALQQAGVDARTLFVSSGPVLVRRLVAGVAGALPRNRIPDVADILFSLGVVFGHTLGDWLAAILAPLPEVFVPDEEKGFLINGILYKVHSFVQAGRSVSRQEDKQVAKECRADITDCLDEFADVCRCTAAARTASLQALAG